MSVYELLSRSIDEILKNPILLVISGVIVFLLLIALLLGFMKPGGKGARFVTAAPWVLDGAGY